MKSRLILVIGNIGTGKTSFINKLKKTPNRVFCFPDLTHYPDYCDIETYLRDGKDVILEGPYPSVIRRRDIIDPILKLFPKIQIICFDFGPGDADTVTSRIGLSSEVSIKKWHRIHQINSVEYQPPSKDEGIYKIISKIKRK